MIKLVPTFKDPNRQSFFLNSQSFQMVSKEVVLVWSSLCFVVIFGDVYTTLCVCRLYVKFGPMLCLISKLYCCMPMIERKHCLISNKNVDSKVTKRERSHQNVTNPGKPTSVRDIS